VIDSAKHNNLLQCGKNIAAKSFIGHAPAEGKKLERFKYTADNIISVVQKSSRLTM
jgi:hypothetical protein